MLQLLNLSKVILLFFVCSVININCKSKSGKTNTPLTIENIAGVYTITDAKIKTGDTEKDVYSSFNDCQKNNTYGFNKDMVWYLGGVARQTCTGPDDSGTWSLNGNTLTINSRQSGAYQYTITDFNGSVMVAESQSDNNGTPETLITTFTKKQ